MSVEVKVSHKALECDACGVRVADDGAGSEQCWRCGVDLRPVTIEATVLVAPENLPGLLDQPEVVSVEAEKRALLDAAKARDIDGRASMSRDDLIEALTAPIVDGDE